MTLSPFKTLLCSMLLMMLLSRIRCVHCCCLGHTRIYIFPYSEICDLIHRWELRLATIRFYLFYFLEHKIDGCKFNVLCLFNVCASGVMNSLFSVYGKKQTTFSFLLHVRIIQDVLSVLINEMFSNYLDIYDDLISRRVHSSDAEKFAEICPCPCNGVGWGVIWSALQFQ